MPRFRNSLKPDYGRTILGLLPVPDAARRADEVRRCSPDAPCGAVWRQTFRASDFVIFECLNAHSHRVPPLTHQPEPASARQDPLRTILRTPDKSDPEERFERLRDTGLCVWCGRKRGTLGTSTHCGSCRIVRREYQRAQRAKQKAARQVEAG